MNRDEVALALLPHLIATIDGATAAISDTNRQRVVDSAFAWADAYLATVRDHAASGLDDFLAGPIGS